jgi:hypothetical protein
MTIFPAHQRHNRAGGGIIFIFNFGYLMDQDATSNEKYQVFLKKIHFSKKGD